MMDILKIILEAYKIECVFLVTWFILYHCTDLIWNKIKEYKRRRTLKQCKVHTENMLVILNDMEKYVNNYLKEKGDK